MDAKASVMGAGGSAVRLSTDQAVAQFRRAIVPPQQSGVEDVLRAEASTISLGFLVVDLWDSRGLQLLPGLVLERT
jgi:hypothetical protein